MPRQHQVRVGSHHRDSAVLTGDVFNNFNAWGYIEVQETTVCTLAETWYPIEATFTLNSVEGFTPIEGPPFGLRYDGVQSQCFEIVWAATCRSSGLSVISIGVAIDGATPTPGTIHANSLVNDTNQMSGPSVVRLEEGEVVSFSLKSSKAADTIIFDHFVASIRPFCKSPAY